MARKERKDAYRGSEWAIDYHNTVIPVHSMDISVYIYRRTKHDLYKESTGLIYTIHTKRRFNEISRYCSFQALFIFPVKLFERKKAYY